MATKFCCTVPGRSTSPQGTPPRPLKKWKSLATITNPLFPRDHVSHPPISASAGDLEFFVITSLPEDHPNALRLPGRKPSLDESIIRSPNLSRKLRRQLSRKSFSSSKSGLRAITFSRKPDLPRSQQQTSLYNQERHLLNIECFNRSIDFDPDALSLKLDASRLASLQNDNTADAINASTHKVDTHGTSTTQTYHNDDRSTPLLRRSQSTSRSVRVPEPCRDNGSPAPMRRARSTSSFVDSISMGSDRKHWQLNAALTDFDTSWQLPLREWLSPTSQHSLALSTVHEQASPFSEPGSDCVFEASHRSQEVAGSGRPSERSLLSQPQMDVSTLRNSSTHFGKLERPTSQVSNSSVHLYNMHISQHLRSPSQQTDATSFRNLNKLWNHHLLGHTSLNSIMYSSADSSHQRGISAVSFASPAASPTGVRSVVDASSSVYSLRPSTSEGLHEDVSYALPYDIPHVVPGPLNDQLCKQIGLVDKQREKSDPAASSAGASVKSESGVKKISHEHTDDLCDQSTQHPQSSLAKSSSSGSLGRLSKFKEDLITPTPVEGNRKRRSVLQILFPKLAKPKIRSISTPLLRGKNELASAMFDGPSDDNNLLSVPGQSFEGNASTPRSQSLRGSQSGGLVLDCGTSGSMSGPSSLSLTEYQLSLSVSGDDRRRKSAIDVDTVQPARKDDKSKTADQSLRRALPLSGSGRGTENTLMEKALHQHRLEKAALFRVNSRRSEISNVHAQAPVFNVLFSASAASTPGRMPMAMDDVDPLDTAKWPVARRSKSMQQLRRSEGFAFSKQPSTTWTMSTSSTTAVKGRRQSTGAPASWSRFPSHTRAKRCGSAGREDDVITHDFAHSTQAEEEPSSLVMDFDTPSTSKPVSKLSIRKKRNWIVKSRSMTFGSVMRYYSNLFTSSAARNRRSSVTTGGRLEHPELEVLPPTFLTRTINSPHHAHSSGHVGRVVDHIKEEGHHLKEEGYHLKEETHEVFATHSRIHLHHHESEDGLDPLAEKREGIVREDDSEDESEENSPELSPPRLQLPDYSTRDPATLDGFVDDKPSGGEGLERILSARRLSRMYQAYVQLPTSLDATAGMEEEELQDAKSMASCRGDKRGGPSSHLLTVPTRDVSVGSTGTIVRRFPSVTVVDDRKGHWRSISLVSASSGKSLRNSTNDLLQLIKEAESVEREKLLKPVTAIGQRVRTPS